MLCICLSCCAPSRRAQQTHRAALGSPASIQHLFSLPVRTLQALNGWRWSSCFICFNHRFRIWSVRFWVREKSSESFGLAQCGDVALMRRFPPSLSHAHTLWVLYPLYSQEGRQVQPKERRQQPYTALHSWQDLVLHPANTSIPLYDGCVKSRLIDVCHLVVDTIDGFLLYLFVIGQHQFQSAK